ncbi:hypothetical protein ACI3EW_00985 [Pilosibacter sp. HC1M1C21]|uniref:hypothetical protein n=1 Tax=Pilosibacter sp. HC1M1C21 TaxID=3378803 RepID=UPI00385DC4F8
MSKKKVILVQCAFICSKRFTVLPSGNITGGAGKFHCGCGDDLFWTEKEAQEKRAKTERLRLPSSVVEF